MRPRVYIETTIPSYLTARPSRDVVWEANRQVTVEWWEVRRQRFELVTSQFTLDECGRGEGDMAAARLTLLAGLPLVDVSEAVNRLSDQLTRVLGLPTRAKTDADHAAAAAVHAVEYLLTWNCKHLANPALWAGINRTCVAAGYRPPFICTPALMMEDDQ